METITVERHIAAPIDDVFDWLVTTTNYTRTRWVPRARLAVRGADAPYGVGAVRLHTWLIGWFRERITAYDRPHHTAYVVERGFPPARHDGGSMTFTEVPGGTRVVWTTTAEVSLPFFGAAVTRAIAKPVIAHVFGAILSAAATALAAPRP